MLVVGFQLRVFLLVHTQQDALSAAWAILQTEAFRLCPDIRSALNILHTDSCSDFNRKVAGGPIPAVCTLLEGPHTLPSYFHGPQQSLLP